MKVKLISMFLSLEHFYTKFHRGRQRRFFHEFDVEKLVLLSFAEISARSSQKSEASEVLYTFFLHVQCCVRGGASNFQVLTRKGGGARAFGNVFEAKKSSYHVCARYSAASNGFNTV